MKKEFYQKELDEIHGIQDDPNQIKVYQSISF